ncbi:hypothetical protein JFT86_23305 [Pseudomonas sp. TH06]|uniref:hypothetical protein n=1 Tax=Pseudomonas sp. TH06 TaxID=2796372 RepID=UPI001911B83C|nr:hypothetical protein [Pseudomonas sp. TH06]MBK5529869.1 hypothetical protein [Pseudomonas sp. TH06]
MNLSRYLFPEKIISRTSQLPFKVAMYLHALCRVAVNLEAALHQRSLDLFENAEMFSRPGVLKARRCKYAQRQKSQSLAIQNDGNIDMRAIHVMPIGAEYIVHFVFSAWVASAKQPDAQPPRQEPEQAQLTAFTFISPNKQ